MGIGNAFLPLPLLNIIPRFLLSGLEDLWVCSLVKLWHSESSFSMSFMFCPKTFLQSPINFIISAENVGKPSVIKIYFPCHFQIMSSSQVITSDLFVLLLYYFRLYLSCKCMMLKLFVTVKSVTKDWKLQSERKRLWW